MSWQYGWNAQSALLPEEKKMIKVGDKGLSQMQSAMLIIKEGAKNKKNSESAQKNYSVKEKHKYRNTGIEERIRKDEQFNSSRDVAEGSPQQSAFVRQSLLKKAQMYSKIEKEPKNHSKLLVDFVQKQQDAKEPNEKDEYERLRSQFYQGKLAEVMKQQSDISLESPDGEQTVSDQLRQKLAWEKEVLEELQNNFESGQKAAHQKEKVLQSFDRKLTAEEKEALEQIFKQKIEERTKREQIRKKREASEALRQEKLRKLIKQQ